MALRSLHIPAAPSLQTYATGLLVTLAYGAASYAFNHTALGAVLREIPFVYFVGFQLTFAIAPAAGILGHVAARRPATLGWLGLGLGPRDLSAAAGAFTLGCVVASFTISTDVGAPGGLDEAARIFANLLVASASDAVVALGVAANLVLLALRELWKNPPLRAPEAIGALVASGLLGIFHLSHSPPMEGLDRPLLLAAGWLTTSALFVLTRSLIAAILFLNTISLISVIPRDFAQDFEREVELQASIGHGIALTSLTLALFIGTLWLSSRGSR